MSRGQIRIIGGKWRSRQLKIPPRAMIQPSSDRVRETLFNWLSPVIEGAYCLDLFAGTGALGLEALSRGASWVGFVEHSYHAANAISAHLEKFDALHQAKVYHQSYQNITKAQLLSHMPSENDIHILFLDPPFRKGLLIESLNWLSQQALLNANMYLYMEYEKELTLPQSFTDSWYPFRQGTAGQVCYSLWKKQQN